MNEVALPPRRSLPDAQAWRGEMSDVGLDWVGMQGIALPLELAGKPLMAKVDAGINLRAEAAGERGIHMSRLYLALDELTQGELTPQRIGLTLQAFGFAAGTQRSRQLVDRRRAVAVTPGAAVAAARLESLSAAH